MFVERKKMYGAERFAPKGISYAKAKRAIIQMALIDALYVTNLYGNLRV
jgi:hypothetical protein